LPKCQFSLKQSDKISVIQHWHFICKYENKITFILKTYRAMLPILRNSTPTLTLFDRFFDDEFFKMPVWNDLAIRNPLHDIVENEKEYVVELSLAGVKKENIFLNLDNDVLSISAERKESDQKYNRKQTFYGKYEKSFTLPESVDKENIQASFEDGILKLSIPKLEKEEKKATKQIEIK
jgi:HSP20 family protein